MAAAAGEPSGSDEPPRQGLPQSLLAPDRGCVEKKRSRKFGLRGEWRRVHLLARMDLRWIDAKGGADLPGDTKAWVGKGRSIALMRGETEVIYTEGEREWTVALGGDKKEFRAESPEVAAQWVATLRWRVRPWIDLLQDQSVGEQGLLGGLQDCEPSVWPLRAHHLETGRSVVGVLEAAAKFTNDVLATVPVVGPALSVLGFALEAAGRVQSDAECRLPACTRLEQIATRAMETLQKAVEQRAESRYGELSQLMALIEEGARQLESFEHQSTAQMAAHGVFKGKTGPSAVLELASQCEQRLAAYEVHAVDKKLDDMPEHLAESVVSRVPRMLSRIVSRGHREATGTTALSTIPVRPKSIGQEAQLSIVTQQLLSPDAKYVALLGMGGIGKTTLARCVVHEDRIQSTFKRDQQAGCLGLAYVTVSQHPDITKCQRKIWDALVGEEVDFCNAEDGRARLEVELQGKTYCVVLDDVWEVNDMAKLDVAFTSGRVLITSRNDKVADLVHAKCYDVTSLDKQESNDLFRQHAFGGDMPRRWQERHIASIVEKCGGLPLALEIMGKVVSMFRATGGHEEKDMWKNAIAELTTSSLFQESVFDRVFWLSFNSLDSEHQGVLLDLATLPEDYLASECDEAELQACIGSCVDERTTRKILRALEDRALVKQRGQDASEVSEFRTSDDNGSSADGGVRYYLHDVVRECALRAIANKPVAERQRLVSSQLSNATTMDQPLVAKRFCTSQRLRPDGPWNLEDLHMPELKALVLRDAGISELPPSLFTAQLLAVDLTSSGIVKLPPQMSCLQSAKLLRLDYCAKLQCLPNEVGCMVQLRVLSMRECRSIYEIPHSLGNLSMLTKLLMPECGIARLYPSEMKVWHNLTTLDLGKCTGLKWLPPNFGDLTSLTALNLGACWRLSSLPSSIGKLLHLEVLILHKCRKLAELPSTMSNLGHLQELDVQRCRQLVDIPHAIGASWSELRILRLQENDHMAFPAFVENLDYLEVLGIPQACNIPDALKQVLEDPRILLERKETEFCQSNIFDKHNETPLHWGASYGMETMVKLHLGETEVDVLDKEGWTALMEAAAGGHTSTVALLLEKGAAVDHADQDGATALLSACEPMPGVDEESATEVLRVLLEHGAAVDVANKDGLAPLMAVAKRGWVGTAEALLNKGADLETTDKNGKTAAQLASIEGHQELAKMLGGGD